MLPLAKEAGCGATNRPCIFWKRRVQFQQHHISQTNHGGGGCCVAKGNSHWWHVHFPLSLHFSSLSMPPRPHGAKLQKNLFHELGMPALLPPLPPPKSHFRFNVRVIANSSELLNILFASSSFVAAQLCVLCVCACCFSFICRFMFVPFSSLSLLSLPYHRHPS